MSKTKKSSSKTHLSSESDSSEYFDKDKMPPKGKLNKLSRDRAAKQLDAYKKRYEKYSSSDSQSSGFEEEQRNVKTRNEKGETRNKAGHKGKWDSSREHSTSYRYKEHRRKENTADMHRHRNEISRHYDDRASVRHHTEGNRRTNTREHDRSYENKHTSPEREAHRHQDHDRAHNNRYRSGSNDNKSRKRNISPDRNRIHHSDKKKQRNRSNSGSCSPRRKSNQSHQEEHVWGKKEQQQGKGKSTAEKDKPNFGLSGKLTEDVNTFNGIVIKYSEPPEARKPKRRWRLYPFKGENVMATLYIHRQSCYLIGRDRKVVDLPVDHPSCSKQHAALQYRLVTFKRENGTIGKRIRPYLIDLESSNGTFVNNNKIEPKKYVELLERDVIKFGFSSREYVLLHENSKDDIQDDDVGSGDEDIKNVVIKKEPN